MRPLWVDSPPPRQDVYDSSSFPCSPCLASFGQTRGGGGDEPFEGVFLCPKQLRHMEGEACSVPFVFCSGPTSTGRVLLGLSVQRENLSASIHRSLTRHIPSWPLQPRSARTGRRRNSPPPGHIPRIPLDRSNKNYQRSSSPLTQSETFLSSSRNSLIRTLFWLLFLFVAIQFLPTQQLSRGRFKSSFSSAQSAMDRIRENPTELFR